MIDQRLITFLTICRTNNFTKAAELLNLTQPAVSKHISSLEQYYGTVLFKRKGRSVVLTEEGKILRDYANAMEAQTSLMEREIRNSSEAVKHYNIGATLTIGEYVLPHILGKYKETYPNIDIAMYVNNTEVIGKKLLEGEIDLGLVEGPFDMGKFRHTVLKNDELVFTVSPLSNFAGRAEVELDEILSSRLILREEGSGTRRVLEDKLAALGYSLKQIKPYMEIGSLGAIKSLVELNLGCTIISRAAIQKEAASGSLVSIPIKGVRILRDFCFIYLQESPKEFVDSFIGFSVKNELPRA